MATPPPAGGPPAGTRHGGSALSKLTGNRNMALLAAGGTVALVALIASFRSKSSSNQGTTVMSSGQFDSSPYDMWNAWQSEYEDLQQQLNARGGDTTATGPGTPAPPPPVPVDKPPQPTPAPKPLPLRPRPKPHPLKKYVTIHHNDTLSGIAAKNHISFATLKKLNPTFWKNPKYHQGNRIWAGGHVRVR